MFDRRREQPAVDRRRRRVPRRRQAAPLPRGRLPARVASSARSTAPTSSTGRSTTTSSSRTTRRPSASSALPATTTGNPFAAWRSGPYPMPPGPDMFCAVLTVEAATRAGLPPVPRADRREQRRVRRPARVQQLRLLRRSSAARSRPRVIRSRRCVTRCAPAAARSAPSRTSPTCCSTHGRPGRAASATSMPRASRTRSRPGYVILGAGAFETPAAPAAIGDRQPRRRRPLPHVPLPDVRARHLPVPAPRAPRPLRDAPHGRPDRPRRRRPCAAARDAGLPWIRGGIVEHGGAAHPISEAIHLPPGARPHAAHAASRRCATGMAAFTMQGEDLPQATNRIDLDPTSRDVWGLPAGRVTYSAASPRDGVRPSIGPRGSRR